MYHSPLIILVSDICHLRVDNERIASLSQVYRKRIEDGAWEATRLASSYLQVT